MATGSVNCFYHVDTHFGSYLSQILKDFASIWVILKLTGVGPKSPNAGGSGSDQNPESLARTVPTITPCPWDHWYYRPLGHFDKAATHIMDYALMMFAS